MADTRRKNVNWAVCKESDSVVTFDKTRLAIIMDIRDALHRVEDLLRCYRIPKALDVMIELGVEARRKKRLAAKRRKSKRERA